MRRGWKIALGVLVVLGLLLAINTVTTDSQTKGAAPTVPEGQILELSRGDVQVTDTGRPETGRGQRAGQPIVLLHCYTCSLRWYDRLEPLLAKRHRVIRIDLLGHGGSEKPESGYEIENQAGLVAEVLSELGVQGALVAGQSLGAIVATSLAEQASQLVDRAVIIDMGPNTSDFGPGLPLTNRITRVPVIGEALWRITPDFAIRANVGISFAPAFDLDTGFEDPDVPVDDLRAMTYTSYDQAPERGDDYTAQLGLDERFRRAAVPLMVVFGAEDRIFDAEEALAAYEDVPGVRTELLEGVGHAPSIEAPAELARLIGEFAIDEVPVPQPGAAADRQGGNERDRRQNRRNR